MHLRIRSEDSVGQAPALMTHLPNREPTTVQDPPHTCATNVANAHLSRVRHEPWEARDERAERFFRWELRPARISVIVVSHNALFDGADEQCAQ